MGFYTGRACATVIAPGPHVTKRGASAVGLGGRPVAVHPLRDSGGSEGPTGRRPRQTVKGILYSEFNILGKERGAFTRHWVSRPPPPGDPADSGPHAYGVTFGGDLCIPSAFHPVCSRQTWLWKGRRTGPAPVCPALRTHPPRLAPSSKAWSAMEAQRRPARRRTALLALALLAYAVGAPRAAVPIRGS